jgi:GTP-binding protein
MTPLFDLVLGHIATSVNGEGPFHMLGTILEANPHLGIMIRTCFGIS